MTADVARDLAAARRVPDQRRLPQLELVHDRGQVIRVGVHGVAAPRLGRPAVTAPVVRDDAEAVARQEEELDRPRRRRSEASRG